MWAKFQAVGVDSQAILCYDLVTKPFCSLGRQNGNNLQHTTAPFPEWSQGLAECAGKPRDRETAPERVFHSRIMGTLKEFTPVVGALARQVGLTKAAICGLVWRYQMLNDDCCWTSFPTMAKELGISERAVRYGVKDLLDQKYLYQLPSINGKTKRLRITYKTEYLILKQETPANSAEVTPAKIADDNTTLESATLVKLKRKHTRMSEQSDGRDYHKEIDKLLVKNEFLFSNEKDTVHGLSEE